MKSKITKILNSEENPIGKSIITWQHQMTKHIKNEWSTYIRTCKIYTFFLQYQFIIEIVYIYLVGYIPNCNNNLKLCYPLHFTSMFKVWSL